MAFRQAKAEVVPVRFVANRLEFKQSIADDGLNDVLLYAEIERIIKLPIVHRMTDQEVEAYSRQHLLAAAFDQGFRFFRVQAEAGLAYQEAGGVLGEIGVGWGKTLAAFHIMSVAVSAGIKKATLHIPAHVLPQLLSDIKWARTRIPINYSIHVLGGLEESRRRDLAGSGKKGLYVLPYSLLSAKDAVENLEAISPELVICDEAHNVAKKTAARTKRLIGYIDEHEPQLVALSGTITRKSIRDYWHLVKAALGDNNPLPNSSAMASEWGAVIDAEGCSANTGPLLPLVHWARTHFPEMRERLDESVTGFRTAFKLRKGSVPGVVSSGDAEIGTSLVISNAPIKDYQTCEGWASLEEFMRCVDEEWTTPNGDEIEHAIHTFKWNYELTCGFYNELTWPTADVFAERNKIARDEAEETLNKAREHHAANQDYAKILRRFLQEAAKPGYDTPFLVAGNMHQHGGKYVWSDLYDAWRYAHSLDFPGRPERDRRAVRVCAYKINAAVQWAKDLEGKGGILWVHNQEAGAWLSEALTLAGVDCLYCPSGQASNKAILDPANGCKKVVASLPSHGTGKNLQHFEHQYWFQWPRPADAAEQGLGRLHRNGQKADELIVWRNATTLFDDLNFASCVNDALYTHQTTGNRQKLVYASYDPLPKMFPAEVLRQRGFENHILNAEQKRMLADKFGV